MVNFNDLTARKFIRTLLLVEDIVAGLALHVVVTGNMAHLLLHFSAEVSVMVLKTSLSTLLDFSHELHGDIVACNIDSVNGVRQCETFKHWHGVGDAVSALSNQTCR